MNTELTDKLGNPVFADFPKMARLSRQVIVTEKIDGTNAQILICAGYADKKTAIHSWYDEETNTDMIMLAASRNRFITPQDDNFGFAKWAKENAESLKLLGEGRHFGEWWGGGIGRAYDFKKGEKIFSLFNTSRWSDDSVRPGCCSVVPVLYEGIFDTAHIETALAELKTWGSVARAGYMRPEGIVCFHAAAGICFKRTIEKDETPKSLA